jgi:hypothetical protein
VNKLDQEKALKGMVKNVEENKKFIVNKTESVNKKKFVL